MPNKRSRPLAPALILSGGGARAAYQVGVLAALGEILPQPEIPFPVLCGTSAGSVNTAFLASGASTWPGCTKELAHLWKNLDLDQIYKTSGLAISRIAAAWISRTALGGLTGNNKASNYLLDTKPLDQLLKRRVNFEAIRDHLDSGVLQAVSFSAVEYFAQTTVSFFDSGPKFEEWAHSGRRSKKTELNRSHVMASAAIPVFFPPIKIGSSYFGDGCLRQNSPLSPAIHLGASCIVSVGIRPERRPTKKVPAKMKSQAPSLAQIVGEIFNALFLDSMDSDIERAQRVNEVLEALQHTKGFQLNRPIRHVPILHLAPSRNLTDLTPNVIDKFPSILSYCIKGLGVSSEDQQGKELLSYLAFLPECIEPLIQLGYEDTMPKKGEIQDFLEA